MPARPLYNEMKACLTPSTGLVSAWAKKVRGMYAMLKVQREAIQETRRGLKEAQRYIESSEAYKDFLHGDARPLSVLIQDREMPEIYYRIIELQGKLSGSLKKIY